MKRASRTLLFLPVLFLAAGCGASHRHRPRPNYSDDASVTLQVLKIKDTGDKTAFDLRVENRLSVPLELGKAIFILRDPEGRSMPLLQTPAEPIAPGEARNVRLLFDSATGEIGRYYLTVEGLPVNVRPVTFTPHSPPGGEPRDESPDYFDEDVVAASCLEALCLFGFGLLDHSL